jgi:hypothetical protein
MDTNKDTERSVGAISGDYACALRTALLQAGAPGRVQCAQYPAESGLAHEGPHARWPFVRLHLAGRDVRVFCLPTSQGVVLVIADATGTSRCLPTWGAPARAFGAATLAVAREVLTGQHATA